MNVSLRAPIVIHMESSRAAWLVYAAVSLVRSTVIGFFTLYASYPSIPSPIIREAVHVLGVVLALPTRFVGLIVPSLRSGYYPLATYRGMGMLDYAAMERMHVIVTTAVWFLIFLLARYLRFRTARVEESNGHASH